MIPASWIAGGIAVAVVVGLLGVQRVQLSRTQTALAEERAGRAQDRELAASEALAAGVRYRVEEQRRATALQETINATQPALEAARAAAARVPDLDRRVRDATAAVTACRRGAAIYPAAAAGSAPADQAERVLAELQRSAQAAEAARARFADEAAAAGERCERSYDALTTEGRP